MVTQGPLETITDFTLRVLYLGDLLLKQLSPPWSPKYWKQVTVPRIVEMFLNGLQKSGKDLIDYFESPKTWDYFNEIAARTEKLIFEYSKQTNPSKKNWIICFACSTLTNILILSILRMPLRITAVM